VGQVWPMDHSLPTPGLRYMKCVCKMIDD